jgi:hypothetical protein
MGLGEGSPVCGKGQLNKIGKIQNLYRFYPHGVLAAS